MDTPVGRSPRCCGAFHRVVRSPTARRRPVSAGNEARTARRYSRTCLVGKIGYWEIDASVKPAPEPRRPRLELHTAAMEIGCRAAKRRARLSGRRSRSALRKAVPDVVRAGSAGAPARMPGASRPAVRGSRRSGRCTCAKHSAQAVSASANGEPRACAGEAGTRRAKRGGERGAKRARLLRLPPHERQHRAAAVEAKEERTAPPE